MLYILIFSTYFCEANDSIIYESAGIIKSNSNNTNDSVALEKKLKYYERLFLEKELLIKMQEDEINFLKKKRQQQRK
ncbi:hypothetical protein [Marinitoga sp. 1154]|uniref:hypothetical protein n=1 Tax=Marinitoga sp. 1154 TaxID=1643335 RepID=UPI001585D9A9|nr:hypothetical protein [Marinitoga sp. 1154]